MKFPKDINKKLIAIFAGAVILSLVVGFYAGRIYDRRTFRRNFGQRMQGSQNLQNGQRPQADQNYMMRERFN